MIPPSFQLREENGVQEKHRQNGVSDAINLPNEDWWNRKRWKLECQKRVWCCIFSHSFSINGKVCLYRNRFNRVCTPYSRGDFCIQDKESNNLMWYGYVVKRTDTNRWIKKDDGGNPGEMKQMRQWKKGIWRRRMGKWRWFENPVCRWLKNSKKSDSASFEKPYSIKFY